jgi:hypothetical protein
VFFENEVFENEVFENEVFENEVFEKNSENTMFFSSTLEFKPKMQFLLTFKRIE